MKKKTTSKKPAKKTSAKTKSTAPLRRKAGTAVKLLSGGNPQIPKGDGDAPVQAYIKAAPGWKGVIAKKLDSIITKTVPHVQKAVKWNTPFYGIEGDGFFLGFHCFNNYVKVSFFNGTSLKPLPPSPSKVKNVRYLDIREEGFDEKLFTDWVKQASRLPGWKP